uniref:Uncharacterized protein n=1 Tax=Timema genevievae TaxID=629358 RepID=A0A7R9K2X2_TIMGE|nr:unnamed protein product [Timema genevievae]
MRQRMWLITLVVETVVQVVQLARESFMSGKTKPLSFREKQLKQFLKMYEENEDEMVLALATDLRKLANALAVLSSTAEDGEIEVRISVG